MQKSFENKNKNIETKQLIELWLDDYWTINMIKCRSVTDFNEQVHQLIHKVLLIGDEQLRENQGKMYNNQINGMPIDLI